MRINEISAQLFIKKYSGADKVSGAAGTHGVSPGRDKVELSSDAQGWLDALKAAREADPVNPAKVQEVSDRIAKGNYDVSAADVAQRMLNRNR